MRVVIRELKVLSRPVVHYRNSTEPLKASPAQHHQTVYRRASHRPISIRAVATSGSIFPTMSTPDIPPATLPGTPKSFNIPADKLIETAKQVYKANSGVDDPSLLADNFRFEFPVVSLAKQVSSLAATPVPVRSIITLLAATGASRSLLDGLQDYVKAVQSFKLKEAFPNMESHPYDWRVDPYEPQRVWFTIRSTAKHTGPLNFAGATYKATNKVSACDTSSQMAKYLKPVPI